MSEEFTVTRIKKVRYNLYHVIFNDEIIQKFTDETMVLYNVKENSTYSQEDYEKMIVQDQIKRAKSRGLDIISRSSKSKMQIKTTLRREGYINEAIDTAIVFLENYEFVDDKKLANHIAKNTASTKKWSKRQMVSKLMEKGISKDDIQVASQLIDDDQEMNNAIYHAEKKFKSLSKSKPFEERLTKTAQSLGYKGFSYDVITKALEKIKQNYEE